MNLLRLFFSFYGRIGRARYWAGWAAAYAVIAIAMVVWALLPSSDTVSFVVGLICLTCVFTLIPVSVKRLHDLDITGWWVAIFLVAYSVIVGGTREQLWTSIGSLVLFIAVVWLGSSKGEPSGNRHGPAPQ